jgi:tRNA modification GTPase
VDTIAAPITPPGHSAVAVIRASGPGCQRAITELAERSAEVINEPRKLVFTPLFDRLHSSEQQILDHALAAFFPAPNSFTGEDCVEFQIHGSPFLVARLLENLQHLGVRMARPGEFSERAFLNGRMDLSQAEAVADLIAAETAAQARVATEQLDGKLARAIQTLGEPLRNLLAEVEANIDFPDEGIEPQSYQGWNETLCFTNAAIEEYLSTFSFGRLVRDGARVVLVGLPNAGKSSLLNRLLGEQRAIVTPIPGTTRDTIEERISLDGLLIRLIDTAGLQDESATARALDPVEEIGVRLSWKQLAEAELVLFVFDATADLADQRELITRIQRAGRPLIALANKTDLLTQDIEARLTKELAALDLPAPVLISALTGAGLDLLREAIVKVLMGAKNTPSSTVTIANQRHYDALKQASQALLDATQAVANRTAPEFIALHLREALGALTEIVGVTFTEDILGRIFSKFCIGK